MKPFSAGCVNDVRMSRHYQQRGKVDHGTYDIALAFPNEEVEREAWFSEYLSEGPSGHFRRSKPGTSPYVRRFMPADFD